MSTLTDAELLQFNQLGLIPGPEENETEFVNRAQYCLQLKNVLPSLLEREQVVDTPLARQLIQDAAKTTRKLFDITPEWVPVIFSNHRLAFWHGGCAWIFQFNAETPTAAFFQLRQAFSSASHYLGLYDREELIAHESAHVGRMLFQEPKFEETLAYRTAKSRFRQWLGAIVQSSWESLLFVFIIVISLFIDSAALFWGEQELYSSALAVKALLIFLIAFGIGRSWLRQKQLSRCLHALQNALGDADLANAVAYRLQDKEIISFGSMSPKEIKQYANEQAELSLRWRLINLAYFRS